MVFYKDMLKNTIEIREGNLILGKNSLTNFTSAAGYDAVWYEEYTWQNAKIPIGNMVEVFVRYIWLN